MAKTPDDKPTTYDREEEPEKYGKQGIVQRGRQGQAAKPPKVGPKGGTGTPPKKDPPKK